MIKESKLIRKWPIIYLHKFLKVCFVSGLSHINQTDNQDFYFSHENICLYNLRYKSRGPFYYCSSYLNHEEASDNSRPFFGSCNFFLRRRWWWDSLWSCKLIEQFLLKDSINHRIFQFLQRLIKENASPIKLLMQMAEKIVSLKWNLGMYLTSTVGRGGIKYLTPREGIKISSPRAEGARGRNFSTFPRGEVFYTSPPDCSGKAFLHSHHTLFHTPPGG